MPSTTATPDPITTPDPNGAKPTLTIDPSYFTKYNNTVTLNYTSDKHFLNGTYQFYVYNVINTTVSVNVTDDEGNPREPIQNKSFSHPIHVCSG